MKDDDKLHVPQGTLDLMILTILVREPMHGYGISQRLAVLSRDSFRVNPGSLFPSLYRLEQDGKLKAEWRASENNRQGKGRPPDGSWLASARSGSAALGARVVGYYERAGGCMTWSDRIWSMLPWVFRRSNVERRLADELQMFVEMSAADKMRDGASPAEARRQALLELGDWNRRRSMSQGPPRRLARRNRAERALRAQNARQESRLHRGDRPDAGARRRREHRHLLHYRQPPPACRWARIRQDRALTMLTDVRPNASCRGHTRSGKRFGTRATPSPARPPRPQPKRHSISRKAVKPMSSTGCGSAASSSMCSACPRRCGRTFPRHRTTSAAGARTAGAVHQSRVLATSFRRRADVVGRTLDAGADSVHGDWCHATGVLRERRPAVRRGGAVRGRAARPRRQGLAARSERNRGGSRCSSACGRTRLSKRAPRRSSRGMQPAIREATRSADDSAARARRTPQVPDRAQADRPADRRCAVNTGGRSS